MLEIIKENEFDFYLYKKDNFKSDKKNIKWFCFEYDWLNQLNIPNFKLYYCIEYGIDNFYGLIYSSNHYVNYGMTIINNFFQNILPEHYRFWNGKRDYNNKCFAVYLYHYNASSVFIDFKTHQMLKLNLTLIKNCNYDYILNTNKAFTAYRDYTIITQLDKYKILINILKQKNKKNETY